ncbi:MAG: hypothetical protein ACQCN4_07905 [Candidatus Bathyarchaeia archaeon]|jgi:hypothetical protein
MSDNEYAVSFTAEQMQRLKNARTLFENDTNRHIELDAFVDMLVETYLSYRNLRGANESSILQKLTDKP